jgi:hypothetical protein
MFSCYPRPDEAYALAFEQSPLFRHGVIVPPERNRKARIQDPVPRQPRGRREPGQGVANQSSVARHAGEARDLAVARDAPAGDRGDDLPDSLGGGERIGGVGQVGLT